MRRLPVFFLVDVSESMIGSSLYALEEGLAEIVKALRADPHALETVHLAVIAFAGRARTLTPLCELTAFHPTTLPVGGGTALGAALLHLMDEIDGTVRMATADRKGDWRPIVFLMTDGHPTDDVGRAVDRWNASYRRFVQLIAVSIGGTADHRVLARLTDHVLVLDDTAADAFAGFVTWISRSIQSQSRSVGVGKDETVSLAKADPRIMAPAANAESLSPFAGVDERFAIFLGRCQESEQHYIVKYEQHLGRIETRDPVLAGLLQTRRYMLKCTVPVARSYFDLAADEPTLQSVNSQDIIGQPSCPHCGSRSAMAVCGCGGVHCITGPGEQTCPWCGETGHYGSGGSNAGFDIGRSQG